MELDIDATETLTLEEAGNGYVLRRVDRHGVVHELPLLPSSVLTLPQVIQKQIALILGKMTTPGLKAQGVSPIAATQITGFGAAPSVHGDLLIRINDQNGEEYSFSTSPEQAVAIAEGITQNANEIMDARHGTTRNLQ